MAQYKAKDIAKVLQISTAAVSLAINDKPGISEATRQKVFDYLRQLGADEMIPQRSAAISRNLALVIYRKYDKHNVPYVEHSFLAQLMEGINQACRKFGYNLLVTYVVKQTSFEAATANIEQCDGFIILATEMFTEDLAGFIPTGRPFIVLDSYFEKFDFDCIVINNVQGAYAATTHLVRQGHRKIGYLKSNLTINNFLERFEGYRKALNTYDLTFDSSSVFVLGSGIDSSYLAMKEYMTEKPDLPTAFFAENDQLALGAIKAFKEAGLRVPEDISVIGFDNLALAEVSEPGLSTVNVPKEQMGLLAVERLVSKIRERRSEFVKIEIGTNLVERASVRKLN